MNNHVLDDLKPVLMANPLWEGYDEEFAAYVRQAFEVPSSMTRITITRPATSGRSAIAIGSSDGAILFVLSHEGKSTRISPYVTGPIIDDANITARATRSDGEANSLALTSLIVRQLGPEVAVALMAPSTLFDIPTIVDEADGVH